MNMYSELEGYKGCVLGVSGSGTDVITPPTQLQRHLHHTHTTVWSLKPMYSMPGETLFQENTF